jgi:hypothetical protein
VTTILDTTFDGVSDSVDYQMGILCGHVEVPHPRYRRLQISATRSSGSGASA